MLDGPSNVAMFSDACVQLGVSMHIKEFMQLGTVFNERSRRKFLLFYPSKLYLQENVSCMF